jgi:hypothetical protein
MSKALIAFTALLGLFSFHSNAAPDDGSSCRLNAELSQVAFPRFIGASSCSSVGSVFTGNDHCQVKAKPSSTCELDQFGVWVGQNYYFTGCLAGVQCAEETGPDPEDPEDPEDPDPYDPIHDQLNVIDPIIVLANCDNITNTDPNFTTCQQVGTQSSQGFYRVGTELSKLSQNDNVINTNVKTLSERLSLAVLYSNSSENASRAAQSAANVSSSNSIAALAGVNSLKQQQLEDKTSIDDSFTGLNETLGEHKLLHEKTHDSQAIAQTSLDTITDKLPQLDIAVENARHHAQAASFRAENAEVNALDAFYAAGNAEQAAYEVLEAALDTKELTRDVRNLSEDILQILEDGTGGGGSDMSETNDILDDIRMDANSSSISTQIQLQGINDQLGGLSGTINSNAQGLSMQLGQQLSGIQSAIENIETGGGPVDPDNGDTGTHERLDTTNYELSELRNLLDSRTTIANNSLAGIATLIQDGNNLAQAQGQQLTQIAGSLEGVSDSISGLGESIDGLKEGFEGPALTEGDFRPEEGILSALGLTGEESIADLTDDPIYMNDYRNQYDTFLAGTCPDNIPVQFRLLGTSYSFNLFYKPVCDFMEIAGTILNFAVWFGVPFIVFGSRRVS